jgi:hypothetical protein
MAGIGKQSGPRRHVTYRYLLTTHAALGIIQLETGCFGDGIYRALLLLVLVLLLLLLLLLLVVVC